MCIQYLDKKDTSTGLCEKVNNISASISRIFVSSDVGLDKCNKF